MKPDAAFALILPADVYPDFALQASQHQLFPQRICHVKPYETKPPNRVLAEFTLHLNTKTTREELVLFNQHRMPTPNYKQLTSAFYPAF